MRQQRIRHGRRLALALVSILALLAASGPGVAATDPASAATAAAAATWMRAQEQPDGGFEVAGFPGFETPDAVLALAEQSQTGPSWSAAQALGALTAIRYGGVGKNPLDALDDLAENTPTAGQAAKLVVLDVIPLGLDPSDFDPSNDSASPVNLKADIDSGCGANTGSFGAFNATLFAMLAKLELCGVVPPAAVTTVRNAQQANGGWNFAGDPAGTDIDVDTTSLAIQTLVAAGATSTDPAVVRAMTMVAVAQNVGGSWNSPFTTGDPNSTAMGVIAVVAAGYDPTSRCWRDTFAPSRTGDPYNSPDAWLRSQQAVDGHIASPNDVWGVNTFATSQSVEALLRSWLPIARAGGANCASAPASGGSSGAQAVGSDSTAAAPITGGSTTASTVSSSGAATAVTGNPKYAG